MSHYPSPWCPTCSGRKGDSLVCDSCFGRLTEDMKDAFVEAKVRLWDQEARVLTYLQRQAPATDSGDAGA